MGKIRNLSLIGAAAVAATFAFQPQMTQAHHTGKASGTVLGTGMASYYGARFAGRRTASGERFNPAKMTAAHRRLRFGTKVRVTNLRNGRHVTVRINDRGPFAKGRVIDLSRAAARKIGMIRSGTARVRLERVR